MEVQGCLSTVYDFEIDLLGRHHLRISQLCFTIKFRIHSDFSVASSSDFDKSGIDFCNLLSLLIGISVKNGRREFLELRVIWVGVGKAGEVRQKGPTFPARQVSWLAL